ncbi:MAG: nickel pincer cofactor biosynthesis protein LarB [Tindallia sp. MSAO_Bac2]|nr:MAG: nickel pincer cofactor biosynthesis protein LarB [Tindallia sp. MSAO_Bac2]
MKEKELTQLLEQYKKDEVPLSDVMMELKKAPFANLEYARIDHHRSLRNGASEVIYCQGKSLEHIKGIVMHMLEKGGINILGTRATREMADAVSQVTEDVEYYEDSRLFVVNRKTEAITSNNILVVTGGTADIPVAEEAAITAEVLGNKVERLYDVGVAGLHRLTSNLDILLKANVVIAVAGMEGALASVVGGLVDKPVIAVPTSVGYGASFGGVSALLTMLNSCASGVSVVNIDNGFGAAYLASMINHMTEEKS